MQYILFFNIFALLFVSCFSLPFLKRNGLAVLPRNIVETRQTNNKTLFTSVISEQPPPTVKQLNPLELCLCGAFATAFGDFVMHPVDTIKITQQTATVAVNLFQTAKNILLTKGILGFYPGVIPYLIGDGISGAFKFTTFELTKRFSESHFPPHLHGISHFLCAAISMLVASFTLVPAEVIKTRLQAGVANSFVQAMVKTVQSEGIAGLYVGYYATLVRDVPYTMLELGIYENLKTAIKKWKNGKDLTSNDELLAAAITGGVTSFITTPLDLIKTKLMMQSSSGGRYAGVVDGLVSIYQEGGIQGLFVGSAARVAWLLPFTTIYLGVYEAAKKALLQLKNKRS